MVGRTARPSPFATAPSAKDAAFAHSAATARCRFRLRGRHGTYWVGYSFVVRAAVRRGRIGARDPVREHHVGPRPGLVEGGVLAKAGFVFEENGRLFALGFFLRLGYR